MWRPDPAKHPKPHVGPGRGLTLWAPAGKGGPDEAFPGQSAKLKIRAVNTTLSRIREGGDESCVRGWKVRKQALHTPPTVLPFNRHALCQHLEPRERGSPLLPQEPSGLRIRRRTVPAPAGARQQRSGLLHRVLAESPREGTTPRGLPTPATPCCGTWASCRASLSLGASPAPWG